MSRETYFKLCQYFEKYGKYYKSEHINFIMSTFEKCLSEQDGPDIVMQVLSALNLYQPERNFYLGILKEMKKYFDLKCNILEIGGGYYPALAKLIDDFQGHLGGGSITTYDPRLAVPRLGNIHLHKKELDSESLDSYDLVVSAMPCKATELVINKCNIYKKPYLIALCSCPPYPVYNMNESRKIADYWHETLYYHAQRGLDEGASLERIYLPPQYEDECPVFVKTYRNR